MPTQSFNHSFLPDPDRDQHLLDPATARALVCPIDLGPDDLVLDLGAGTGVLTDAVLRRRPRGVIAVEPDRRCRPWLAGRPRVDYRPSRVQDLAPADLDRVAMIIANPPFSALQHVVALARDLPTLRAAYLCTGSRWSTAAAAVPSDDHFSVISLEVGACFDLTQLSTIAGTAFTPPIRGRASWLRLTPRSGRDPMMVLLGEALRLRGGLRIKDLLRSPRVVRSGSPARLRSLRADPLIRRWQQRRLVTLTRAELAALVVRLGWPGSG